MIPVGDERWVVVHPHFGQVGFIGFNTQYISRSFFLSGFPVYDGPGEEKFAMKLERIGILAALSIFPLIGLFLVGVGARNVWREIASSNWPVAEAKVETSQERPSRDILFRYRVNGMLYATNRVSFGETLDTGTASDADLRRFRFPVGRALTVRYNPANPMLAAVEPGFHSEALWLPGVGLGFLLPGILFVRVFAGASENGGAMRAGLSMFAAIFMLAGFALLSSGLTNLWLGYASRYWPIAEGLIVYGRPDGTVAIPQAAAEANGPNDNELVPASGAGSRFVCRYEVAGRKHFANVRLFGEVASSGSDWTSDTAARYALGKKVRVAYSRADPDVAVLEPGIARSAYVLPGAGAAVFLFGLAVLIFGVPALTVH